MAARHLDPVEIDVARYELRVGGMPVHLERRPMELLILLARRHGELVSREEIIRHLWGPHAVLDTEHGINTVIRKIRRALGDDPDSPEYLHTVVGKGYRLVGEVRLSESQAAHPRRPRWLLPGGLGLAALLLALAAWYADRDLAPPVVRAIAVLPLKNHSPAAEHAYLADAMTEAVITELGQLAALRVVSFQSVARYRKDVRPIPEIARELDVDAIVEGAVQREGDRVRITIQFIEAKSDSHLWAREYDGGMEDGLALQAQVAAAVAEQIGARLAPAARARLTQATRLDPHAYEAFMLGSHALTRWSLIEAIEYLGQAIAIEPGFGPAWALLARARYFRAFFAEQPPGEAFAQMRDAAQNAVALDDSRAEALGALGLVQLHHDWDFAAAGRQFERAIALNPSAANVRHDYVHYLLTVGRDEDALAEMETVLKLDPLGTGVNTCHGWHLYATRRFGQALEQGQKALSMNRRGAFVHIILGWAYQGQGAHQEAVAALRTAVQESPGDAWALAALAQGLAAAGQREEARLALQQLDAIAAQEYTSPYDRAAIHAALGEADIAFEWLDRAFAERSTLLVFLTWDPRLDPLRRDPRFRRLMTQMGFPEDVIRRTTTLAERMASATLDKPGDVRDRPSWKWRPGTDRFAKRTSTGERSESVRRARIG
ncbi:MAG TPA: winged helix-turn-helix domain-containing protein [Steroidobacteraceae bacterium]|nr:winged helix-turn-helix domain-containing protein [Steroidobacteraceae bacterium]